MRLEVFVDVLMGSDEMDSTKYDCNNLRSMIGYTFGIMQVMTDEHINNEESPRRAMRKIVADSRGIMSLLKLQMTKIAQRDKQTGFTLRAAWLRIPTFDWSASLAFLINLIQRFVAPSIDIHHEPDHAIANIINVEHPNPEVT